MFVISSIIMWYGNLICCYLKLIASRDSEPVCWIAYVFQDEAIFFQL
jgi:hypothetical protein